MSRETQALLEAFEHLPTEEKRAFISGRKVSNVRALRRLGSLHPIGSTKFCKNCCGGLVIIGSIDDAVTEQRSARESIAVRCSAGR